MNILSFEKIASLNLKDFPKRLLVCFGATSNEARLWIIQLYQSYLENNLTEFTLLCVDNWRGTLGAYRADIAADLRDNLPDKFIDQYLQNVFYYSFDLSSQNRESQGLKVFIGQLKQERKLEEIIVILANESYNVPLTEFSSQSIEKPGFCQPLV
jgi:hypothetical protein